MVTFEELLLAKLITEYELADVGLLRQILREIDSTRSLVGLIPMLAKRGVGLADGRVQEIQRRMQHYLRALRDNVTAEVLKARGVPLDQLKAARRAQKEAAGRSTLMEVLIERGVVQSGTAAALEGEVETRLGKHRQALVEEYRKKDFEGVARPLTRRTSGATTSSHKVPVPATVKLQAAPPPAARPTASGLIDAMSSGVVASERPQTATCATLIIPEQYTLVRQIGKGAMGIVYLARDTGDDRLVAVKVIGDVKSQPEAVDRFKREILAKAFFDHDNVVQIYDAGEFGQGGYFMAMEFVEGEELRQLIEREGPLEPRRALRLIRQVLSGIEAAHKARIIHRDLKPENILIARDGGREDAKVMDFGLARILDRDELGETVGEQIFVTRSGAGLSGTPKYMAPEVLAGDRPTEGADIYAIGLIFFELLTGKLPFEGKSISAIVRAHVKDKPKTLAEVAPEASFPPQLQQFIDRSLEKLAGNRWPSCTEALEFLEQEVEPALGGAPAS